MAKRCTKPPKTMRSLLCQCRGQGGEGKEGMRGGGGGGASGSVLGGLADESMASAQRVQQKGFTKLTWKQGRTPPPNGTMNLPSRTCPP